MKLEDLDTVVMASNKYKCLLPGFALLHNKFYGERPAIIIGDQQCEESLPDNFSSCYTGPDLGPASWSTSLLNFINQYDKDYFLLCHEDHYFINDVNISLFQQALSKLGDYNKIFCRWKVRKTDTLHQDDQFYYIPNNHILCSSVMISVWSTSLLRLFLPRQIKCHEFEQNFKKIGIKTIVPKHDSIIDFTDLIRNNEIVDFRYIEEGIYSSRLKKYMTNELLEIFDTYQKKWKENNG